MDNSDKPIEKNNKWSIVLLIILFILSLGLNVFLFFKYVREGVKLSQEHKEMTELLSAANIRADSLYEELNNVADQLQYQLNENLALQELKESTRIELENKLVELERAKSRISSMIASGGASGSGLNLLQAKAEIEKLKSSNQKYMEELAEVKKSYAEAKRDADHYSLREQEVKIVNDSLVEVNGVLMTKVSLASALRITGLTITGIQEKKNKVLDTEKASRSDKLKINFNIMASKLTKKEEKKLTIRILGTSGEVLSDDVDRLTDSEELNSTVTQFTYDGNELPMTLYFKQKAKYKPGKHIIEIYHEGNLLERRSFTLE